MIEKICLNGFATYDNEEGCEFNPKKINYMFGGNGTGKTSMTNAIGNPELFNKCNIEWWQQRKLKTLVYNKQFVDSNFKKDKDIPGVFTIGEEDVETKKKIKELLLRKTNNDNLREQYVKSSVSIGEQIKENDKNIEEILWVVQTELKDIFRAALRKHRGSKYKFKLKILEQKNINAELINFDELKSKYNKAYSDDVKYIEKIFIINNYELKNIEDFDLIKEAIIGESNSSINNLIKKLNNNDWVVEGIKYLNITDNICPFCQQDISVEITETIRSIITEDYKEKIENLKKFIKEYSTYVDTNIIEKLREIQKLQYQFINEEDLELLITKIEKIRDVNLINLNTKLSNPSLIVQIESLITIIEQANGYIKGYNYEIEDNNKIVESLEESREKINNEVWKFVYIQRKYDIGEYEKKRNRLITSMKGIGDSIEKCKDLNEEIQKELVVEESKTTSIVHTKNAINKILQDFGFDSFIIEADASSKSYRISRKNGEDVKETLSEGEKNFITFLYFYHLIKGNIENSEINQDKIVVIDDPISSLDSDIMFVVSILIKNLIKSCKEDSEGIKQLFILTHNIYFHKEVTFKGRDNISNYETFWIFNKINGNTTIKEYKDNPIKSTYEHLWRQVKDVDILDMHSVSNSMRRILEYYFKVIGVMENIDSILEYFSGKEKVLCKSLLAFVNDGSHTVYEDFHISMNPDMIEKYKEVFKDIFIKSGHEAHYKMMMSA